MEVLDSVCLKLRLNELERVGPINDLSAKTGIKASYIGLAGLSLTVLFVLFGFATSWITFAVGFLYPAYKSFKALESNGSLEDDKQWLTYWVVFSFLHVFDRFLNIILAFIPFSTVLKLAFNIWLFHPNTRGALVIYNSVIRGTLKRYESMIDEHLDYVKKSVNDAQPILDRATKDLKREAINRVIS